MSFRVFGRELGIFYYSSLIPLRIHFSTIPISQTQPKVFLSLTFLLWETNSIIIASTTKQHFRNDPRFKIKDKAKENTFLSCFLWYCILIASQGIRSQLSSVQCTVVSTLNTLLYLQTEPSRSRIEIVVLLETLYMVLQPKIWNGDKNEEESWIQRRVLWSAEERTYSHSNSSLSLSVCISCVGRLAEYYTSCLLLHITSHISNIFETLIKKPQLI